MCLGKYVRMANILQTETFGEHPDTHLDGPTLFPTQIHFQFAHIPTSVFFSLLLIPACLHPVFVNSVFSPCVEWEEPDAQVEMFQLADRSGKQFPLASKQGPSSLSQNPIETSSTRRTHHLPASHSARRRLGGGKI